MDVGGQNSSAQSEATGIVGSLGTNEGTEDQNNMKKNSMRSDAAVKPMEGFEEQSEQPIQKSENQSKTPEWGEVDDIFKTITKELETSDIDNNKSNNNGDLIAKQEPSVINKKGDEFLHGMDAEDQDLKGMTTLQNGTSGITTVQHKKRLEKKNEHIQKSENQPKTPEWGELDDILNDIFNENIDNLTTIQPGTSTGGIGQTNKKTDEEDPPITTVGLIDEENFGKKITKNGRDDVDKTLVSAKAITKPTRTIYDPIAIDIEQSKSNDRKSEAEVKKGDIDKTKNKTKNSQGSNQKLLDDGCHVSDDEVPNAEAGETAVVEKQQKEIMRKEILTEKEESIMPESTEELESSNDKENIEEQGQKEKVAKKLEEKQDTIEVKDDAKNFNSKERADQSKQTNDGMDVIKELGSDGDQAEENEKRETSKEKNKEEDINEVGKSQKDEGNDGWFQFFTTRKKRQKSKAKEKKDESEDGRQGKEESKRRIDYARKYRGVGKQQ